MFPRLASSVLLCSAALCAALAGSSNSLSADAAGASATALRYLTGGERDGIATDIEVDTDGFLYLSGDRILNRNVPGKERTEVFVIKFDRTGAERLYTARLSGSNNQFSAGIALDAKGNAFVVGHTDSPDFPTTPGAAQPVHAGGAVNNSDLFITKLSPTGEIVYSTFLGGGDFENAADIAVTGAGEAFVAGSSGSDDFPTTLGVLQPDGLSPDAIVARLSADGSRFVYATRLGGSGVDSAGGIDVVGDEAVVAGDTYSADFPNGEGAPAPHPESGDAFVARLDGAGASLRYTSFLAGSNVERVAGVAVDAKGAAYVTGATSSDDFPTTPGAAQATLGSTGVIPPPDIVLPPRSDAFVSKIAADGSSVVYSTYVGGEEDDAPEAIAIDSQGQAAITGTTSSAGFPSVAAQSGNLAGLSDAFVTQLNADGTRLLFSSYFGSEVMDWGLGVTAARDDVLNVAGYSEWPSKTALPLEGRRRIGQRPFAARVRLPRREIAGRLTAFPAAVRFPAVAPPDHADFAVRITNSGGRPVTARVGSLNPPFTVLEGGGAFTLEGGRSHRVVLRYQPKTAARANAVLRITQRKRRPLRIPISAAR